MKIFITSGMQTLLDKVFERLEGRSNQASTFLLSQAMGGGKTRNKIALGLLAKNPSLRSKILGINGQGSRLGAIRVIGFNGRESDAKFGLWGELAEQLCTRLFSDLPDDETIREVAHEYAEAVRKAKQMDITNATPESFAAQLIESYPFHFSIRDLYARFKENPGFQQTRGLIRLMRVIVADMYTVNSKGVSVADHVKLTRKVQSVGRNRR